MLTFLNKNTTIDREKGRPILSINKKTGVIYIGFFAQNKMGLTLESKIEFCFDDNNGQLYLFESDREEAYKFRLHKTQALHFCSIPIARKIFDFYDLEDKEGFTFLIGQSNTDLLKGYTLYPVIKTIN